MPQDHFVAETYLKRFTDPSTVKDPKKGGKFHAYRKQDSGYFTPFASGVCKTLNWDITSKYLSSPDALGQWLKRFETHLTFAVSELVETGHPSPPVKYVIAGYWAYLLSCTPSWQRVATAYLQSEINEKYIKQFAEYAKAHPEVFPRAETYLPSVEDGTLTVEVDRNYAKAMAATQLITQQWLLHHQEWNVIENETDELFLTSDNPSCFDYEHSNALLPARYLPLTPRVALWTRVETDHLPKPTGYLHPARNSVVRRATTQFVQKMNILVIKSAENLVLSSVNNAHTASCVEEYREWWVCKDIDIRIPVADGYYEVLQARARPKSTQVP